MIQQSQSDRGVSELLGYSLMVGIVVVTAVTAAIVGMPILEETQNNQADSAAELGMQEVDSRLDGLSSASVSGATEFSFGGNDQHIQGEPKLHEGSGNLTITVNKNASCSVGKSLDSIWVNNTEGGNLAYEAGGVFRQSASGSTWVVSSPSVTVRDGRVDISLTNLSGTVARDSNRAIRDAISSRDETQLAVETLLQGECRRPDNVTVQVESDFYGAWANHFQSQTGLQVKESPPASDSYLHVDESTQTTTVYLDQGTLPRETDDDRNQVLNVSDVHSYMATASVSDESMVLSKDVGNKYQGYAEPVNDPVRINRPGKMTWAYNDSRDPLDVVFVVDESGTMGWDASNHPGAPTRMAAVKDAIKDITPNLNSSKDRVGLVGFKQAHSNRGKIYRTNNKMLTSDFGAFKNTLNQLNDGGRTFTAGGMGPAASLLSLKSDETRDGVIIFLSDGDNYHPDNQDEQWYANGTTFDKTTVYHYNGHTYDATLDHGDTWNRDHWMSVPGDTWAEQATSAATIEMARVANRSGVNTYTIGFGHKKGLNQDLLRDMAKAGDGSYHYANDSDDLEDIYDSISKHLTATKAINRPPLTTTVSVDGSPQPPQMVGDKQGIANVTIGGKTYYNINDPYAPSSFSHGFGISDGDTVEFSGATHKCDQWAVTDATETVEGEEQAVLRCTDMNGVKTTIDGGNVTIYKNEDSSDFTDMLEDTETTEDQPNLTTSAVERGLYDPTTEKLKLESNQALVLFDYPDGPETDNRLLVLYTIGYSEQYRPDGVIDFDITNVEIEG